MKKVLVVFGIICMVAGLLILLFAILNGYGYYHVLDGSADLYRKLRIRMILFSIIGICIEIAAIICLVIGLKYPE